MMTKLSAEKKVNPKVVSLPLKRKRNKLKYFLIILFIIIISLGLYFVIDGNYAYLKSLGYIGAFIISLLGSATIFIPLPSWAVIIAMGTHLNPILLGIVAGLGNALGETTGYLLGLSGRRIIDLKKRSKYMRAFQSSTDKYGALAIFVFSFIPNPLFDIAGLTAGALKMPYWKFLLACFLGKTLRFILFAYAGLFVYEGLI